MLCATLIMTHQGNKSVLDHFSTQVAELKSSFHVDNAFLPKMNNQDFLTAKIKQSANKERDSVEASSSNTSDSGVCIKNSASFKDRSARLKDICTVIMVIRMQRFSKFSKTVSPKGWTF